MLSSRMISLERLLRDEKHYYNDEDSFVERALNVLAFSRNEEGNRKTARLCDWRWWPESARRFCGSAL